MDELTISNFLAVVFEANGNKYRHSLGVARLTKEIVNRVPYLTEDFKHKCVIAGYLHDIGYARSIAINQFHQYDGFQFLLQLGVNIDICHVALLHSYAYWDAAERRPDMIHHYDGLKLSDEANLMIKIVSYADIRTSPNGDRVDVDTRITEIGTRYGKDHPIYLNMLNIRPLIDQNTREVEFRFH
jgi:predicted hydrolase (HD superfamily)